MRRLGKAEGKRAEYGEKPALQPTGVGEGELKRDGRERGEKGGAREGVRTCDIE